MKKIISVFLTICLTINFVSCSKINAVSSEDEYIDFPDGFNAMFMNTYKSTYFYIDAPVFKNEDKKNGSYQAIMSSGSSFISGTAHFTAKGIVLDYPDKIDFTKCGGTDEDKQTFIDFYFPGKSKSFWKAEPELRIGSVKGFYTYKDRLFEHKSISTKLSIGDETYIDGEHVLLADELYTAKDSVQIYEKPDFKSTKIFVTRLNWNYYNTDEYKKIDVLKKYEVPAWKGIALEADAKTVKETEKDKQSFNWYRVSIRDFCGEKYGWVYGGDLVSASYEELRGYKTEIIARGVAEGIIKVEEIDKKEIPQNLKYFSLEDEVTKEIYFNDDVLYLVGESGYAKLSREKLFVDSDGFLKLDLGSKEYLFIDGKRISQNFKSFHFDSRTAREEENDRPFGYDFKSISASSSFSETVNGKKINYTPDNLYKCFYAGGCVCHPYSWNYSHIPWVEGASDSGIGESILVEFTQDMYGISILNGYADINRMKFYKENSRVKTLLVEDLQNGTSQTVNFEDCVYFNYINFSKPTSKIKLTIKDVYSGSKYSDTCISAIIPDIKPFSEEEKSQNIKNNFLRNYIRYEEKQPEILIKEFTN
ncbi:MAG: hypothetical protein KBT21_04855 [Treponema sp.]|nr:hypothetical protein [Candidatus Treponema merdequi]